MQLVHHLVDEGRRHLAGDHVQLFGAEDAVPGHLGGIRRGDTVVTAGGIIGKVTKVTDNTEVEVEIAPNVRVRVARAMIADVRAKGEPVKDTAAS